MRDFRCDRCGKTAEEEATKSDRWWSIRPPWFRWSSIDLCGECGRDFQYRFLKEESSGSD